MFGEFYKKYLGIDSSDKEIYICDLRNTPLNKHFCYHAIITEYDGKIIASVSNKSYELVKQCLDKNITMEQIKTSLDKCFENYSVSIMYRMLLKPGHKAEKINNPKITIRYLSEYRKYIAFIDGEQEPIGYSKISDIYFGYGNIVVWVDEKYRNNGIATALVSETINQCIIYGIEPMYLVKKTNRPSIELAKKLGFVVMQNEIVICEEV